MIKLKIGEFIRRGRPACLPLRCAVILILTLYGLALPGAAQELRWGGDAEGGAPYLLPNPKNPREIIGFEIDLMDAVGKQLNRKSVFVQNQWDGLIPGLQRGNYDLAVNGIEITD